MFFSKINHSNPRKYCVITRIYVLWGVFLYIEVANGMQLAPQPRTITMNYAAQTKYESCRDVWIINTRERQKKKCVYDMVLNHSKSTGIALKKVHTVEFKF